MMPRLTTKHLSNPFVVVAAVVVAVAAVAVVAVVVVAAVARCW
jgi:hypothetical protein